MELNFDTIINELKSHECSTHHLKPIVKLINGKIDIIACCIQFHDQLVKILDNQVNNQIDDDLDNIFGSMNSGTI